jgi:hypothetical protein
MTLDELQSGLLTEYAALRKQNKEPTSAQAVGVSLLIAMRLERIEKVLANLDISLSVEHLEPEAHETKPCCSQATEPEPDDEEEVPDLPDLARTGRFSSKEPNEANTPKHDDRPPKTKRLRQRRSARRRR